MRAIALVLTTCVGWAGAMIAPAAFAQGADKPPATAGAPPDSGATAAAIRAQFDGHVAAHRRGDPAGAAAMYADDVRLIGPDGDESRGRAAMTKFYRDMQDRW